MFALLPRVTLGYVVGVVLADQVLVGTALPRAVAIASLGAGLLLRRQPRLRAWAAVLLIGSCGALALSSAREQAASVLLVQPRDVLVEGTVCASLGTASRVVFDLCDCMAIGPGVQPIPRRLRVFESFDPEPSAALLGLQDGQRIRARLRLLPIRLNSNPGARRGSEAYARRGIGALASLRDGAMLVRVSKPRPRWMHAVGGIRVAIADSRKSIGERLARAGPGGALVRALVLGDRSTLSEAAGHAFARIGIGHLLAVSGLHIALVAGLGFALVRRTCLLSSRLAARRDPREIALIGAFALALVYAGMSGWGIPVRRALLFLGVVCLSVASRRGVRGGQLLSLAALPLLILEPHALFEMSAQLSFVASAGLLLARRPLNEASNALASLIRTSATAIAATAPWVAWHGGSVGIWGVAANLIAVPWVGFVMLPASLLAAGAAALPDVAPTRVVIAGVSRLAGFTLDSVILAASWLPASPGGGAPGSAILCCAGAICVVALRARSTGVRVLLCLVESALLTLAPAREILPLPPRLVSFDVGQGDATLVQGRSGSLLIDAGRALGDSFDMGSRVVIPGLAALDVVKLDLVIASHADLDHRGGLEAVLERIPTGELWLPRGTLAQADFQGLLEIARQRGVEVREMGAGSAPRVFGDLRVIPLWPPEHGAPKGRNDNSLVVRVEVGVGGESIESILLPGDLGMLAEGLLIEGGRLLRSTVLKVGHHGSRGSSSREFLAAVQPKVAVVSAPCHGRGGLPNALAMERLAEIAEEVWWTGTSGAVIVGFATQTRTRVVAGWHRIVPCWKH